MELYRRIDFKRTTHRLYALLCLLAVFLIYGMYHLGRLARPDQNDAMALIESVSIAIPEVIIWFIAVRGAVKFREYVRAIQGTKDGAALTYVANALVLMVVYVIVLTLVAPIEYLFKDTGLLKTVVFLSNHVPVALSLIAAVMFYRGSKQLNRLVPFAVPKEMAIALTMVALSLGVYFIWYFYRFEPGLKPENGIPRFVTPVNVLIFSYVVPYVIAWALEIYACVSLANYAKHVKGELYKPLFRNLGIGVILVFGCTFMAQLLIVSTLSLSRFNALIVLTYGLLLAGVYGFLKIHQGATALHRLEQV